MWNRIVFEKNINFYKFRALSDTNRRFRKSVFDQVVKLLSKCPGEQFEEYLCFKKNYLFLTHSDCERMFFSFLAEPFHNCCHNINCGPKRRFKKSAIEILFYLTWILSGIFPAGLSNCILRVQLKNLGKNRFVEKNVFFLFFDGKQNVFSMALKNAFNLLRR